MGKKKEFFIGTSGWHYKHWKGTFYPEDTKAKDQLALYQTCFDTVELNNSFYRLPDKKTFTQWYKAVPPGFTFSVKGSRYISHMKKLKDSKESLHAFLLHVKALKEKLGPVLFQLPPGWKINTERLERFLKTLPKDYRFAFEFRNHSWYDESVYALLRKYNCAFCIYELDRHTSPLMVTTDFVYVRLHGPEGKYQGSYNRRTLRTWANRCKKWRSKNLKVYFYFDNDQEGYAGFNAQDLKKMLED